MTTQILDPGARAVVDRLHAVSSRQARRMLIPALLGMAAGMFRRDEKDFTQTERGRTILSDKLVALDRDKAQFCYALCRGLNARCVVEAGTSYGVSTIYLASAVRDNAAGREPRGIVIGTEHEPAKAKAARENFAAAGVAEFIDLREGDLRETLMQIDRPVDFMLVDIWAPMARPALERVAPRLHTGSMVVCDNTASYRKAYTDYFQFINNPANGFVTMTLPYSGGLELSVKI
ncbi:MAG: O-methyltransferase [Candidatus Acidiferrales bacterium]